MEQTNHTYLPKTVYFYCNKNNSGAYFNFIQDKRYLRDYGDKDSEFLSVIIREPYNSERSDYFAWWDNDTQEFQCISSSKKALDMCLNNPAEMEKQGDGERINIFIEELSVLCPKCVSTSEKCTCVIEQ